MLAGSALGLQAVMATGTPAAIASSQLDITWLAAAEPMTTAQVTPQGNRVLLNGQAVTVPWSVRQGSVGIADMGLMQTFGVDLLDNTSPASQPVQWFSDPRQVPLALETWFSNQHRFLDISPLADHAEWDIAVNGDTLTIASPPSQMMGIRQGRQPWGDRIVLDLDQPAPWRVTEENQGFTVTVESQITPAALAAFTASEGNLLTSLRVTPSGNRTVIQVGTPGGLRPHVWTLTDPHRLVIDVRQETMVPRRIQWAPGVLWQQQYVSLGNAQFPVYSLTLDLRQPGVALRPITPNPSAMPGIAPLVTTAQRWQAIAAINGGFFNRNNQLPLGAVKRDGRWLSGPILGRGAIAWTDQGNLLFSRLSLQDTLTTSLGQRFSLFSRNSGYAGAGISLYTPEWGTAYSPVLDNETLVTVQNNQVQRHTSATTAGQGQIPIPPDGYVLAVRSYRDAVNALAPGVGVSQESFYQPNNFDPFPQIMGAGPLLLQNRQIVLNAEAEGFSRAFMQQAAPRSVIYTNSEGTLTIAAIHHRVSGNGPTLAETARLVQQLGAVHALNLDGGSSTSLYLAGHMLNRSPRTAARVHNALGVFIQPAF
jgi:hypothetical protein